MRRVLFGPVLLGNAGHRRQQVTRRAGFPPPHVPDRQAPLWRVVRLGQFTGNPAYGLAQLRQDLDRFAFLLGGSDGEPLFGPAPH